jgi:(R,R)-butanediol dehydrogenase/meso-butanediol dehydrogenase/diacetyl reductase
MQIIAAYYTGNRSFSVETAVAPPPGPGEVQVDVAYCGICGTDMHVFHGNMDGRVGDHRVIGHEMSGVVAEVGEGVEGFAPGDKVVVRPLDACGACPACVAGHGHICHRLKFLGLDTDGAMQEKWIVPAHTLHKLPADMPLERAALIEPLAVACHDVRRGRLAAGETALVIGGGPIGMLIAMVAKEAGARVILSEINEARLAMAATMGFTGLDPRKTDVAKAVEDATGGAGADVVFEVSGTQAGVDLMTAAAATRGRIVMVAIHAKKPQIDLFRFFWREIDMLGARVYEPADYEEAIALVASGRIDVDRLITDRHDLPAIQSAFEALDGNPTAMKTLIRCGGAA